LAILALIIAKEMVDNTKKNIIKSIGVIIAGITIAVNVLSLFI